MFFKYFFYIPIIIASLWFAIKPLNDGLRFIMYVFIFFSVYLLKEKFSMTKGEIQKTKEKYNSIVDSIGIGIALINSNMEIISFNNQIKRWFPEINNFTKPVCYEVFNHPARDDICGGCPICKTIKDGKIYTTELNFLVKNEIRNFKIISSPIRDNNGVITLTAEIIEDITFQKNLEKEILIISERERNRVAQDLHDDLGQHLAGIEFKLLTLKNKIKMVSLSIASEIDAMCVLIRQANVKTKRLARGLSTVDIKTNDIFSALKILLKDIQEIHGVLCHFNYDDKIIINDDITAIHLYHIAQEAITNAIKHGKASALTIELKKKGDFIILKIIDNGIGILDQNMEEKGLGMHIMNYRANIINGVFNIEKNIKKGITVSCKIRE